MVALGLQGQLRLARCEIVKAFKQEFDIFFYLSLEGVVVFELDEVVVFPGEVGLNEPFLKFLERGEEKLKGLVEHRAEVNTVLSGLAVLLNNPEFGLPRMLEEIVIILLRCREIGLQYFEVAVVEGDVLLLLEIELGQAKTQSQHIALTINAFLF